MNSTIWLAEHIHRTISMLITAAMAAEKATDAAGRTAFPPFDSAVNIHVPNIPLCCTNVWNFLPL